MRESAEGRASLDAEASIVEAFDEQATNDDADKMTDSKSVGNRMFEFLTRSNRALLALQI